MYKRLLLPTLISMSLTGCFDAPSPELSELENECVTGDCSDIIPPVIPEPPKPPEPPQPPEPPAPLPITYLASLVSANKAISGDVRCNGEQLKNNTFKVQESEHFSCQFGSITLAEFTAPIFVPNVDVRQDLPPTSFNLEETKGLNATKVLQSISSCSGETEICLNEIQSYDIAEIYGKLDDDLAVNDFLTVKDEEATDDIGNAPSSHVDSTIVPAVTPGSSNDLNSGFVSPDAEASFRYKPSAEAQVLTTSKLTDNKGRPLVGISYFSANSTGKTDENGEFEYLWGDTLRFGIETFDFGSLSGNQINYKLTDVTENPLEKENIQSLLERYGTLTGDSIIVSSLVTDTFAQYPNVINELISLNLPNGAKLDGVDFSLPNEFESQFGNGLTLVIDNILKRSSPYSGSVQHVLGLNNQEGNVTQALKAIFEGVTTFHVFNDNKSYYGANGFTRGMRMLNLSNRAFPVMMARTDINREIPFGELQAWTREGKPYIATWPDIIMPAIPLVSKDTATFGFPFVTAGLIGKGNVVFMGNSMYPSILSCPDTYWTNQLLVIDSENKSCSTREDVTTDPRRDNGSMKRFFDNLFLWFVDNKPLKDINVATNMERASFAYTNSHGIEYDFFINPKFEFASVTHIAKGNFSQLSAAQTPILILQAYQPMNAGDGHTIRFIANPEKPNLTQEDITALIRYVNDGGNILFMDAIDNNANPEPIGRLADAAGMSVGGVNVTPTNQAFCGSSYFCHPTTPNLHVKNQDDMVVYERFPDVNGERAYTISAEGEVTWLPPADMPPFEIPKYEIKTKDAEGNVIIGDDGEPVVEEKYAQIYVRGEIEKANAIALLKEKFPGVSSCTHNYEYEFDCIETRSGHDMVVRGNYARKEFERYPVSPEVIDSMIRAANLGSNVQALMDHEIYYRSKGQKGKRLSTVILNQTFDNLSVWLWNDNEYRFDDTVEDELGFEILVNYLNCYTGNKHGGGLTCSEDVKQTLIDNQMIHGEGELAEQLNPSYPLNYMEKPLTRIMLGRSFWDHDITVDVSAYPGKTPSSIIDGKAMIETAGNGISYSAGNNQSTGFWAPQLSDVIVTGGVKSNITVMMADDLTGRPQHETGLNRPPRMQMNFAHNGTSTRFKVPYGGLISITPHESLSGENTVAEFSLSGVEKAAWWKDGKWIHAPSDSVAPIAEIDTGSVIYSTAEKNVSETDLETFSAEMNRFADATSDFYGRDEQLPEGQHRRFTYSQLNGFRHRFVNDVQISIGAAHSGYPVMNGAFNASSSTIPTDPLTSWLLWHEVGHNLAAAPFSVPGSTEVTNNILGLYMQELDDGQTPNPEMHRIKTDIQKAPLWLRQNKGHAWSNGNAGIRLVMFGQLKIWAENHFKIDDWYQSGDKKLSIYNQDEGWNLFKLMHRKTRGDVQGDNLHSKKGENHCSQQKTGLSSSDLLMVCASYVSGHDLSGFFTDWNPGESSSTTPEGNKIYSDGVTDKGKKYLANLGLKAPAISPASVNALP